MPGSKRYRIGELKQVGKISYRDRTIFKYQPKSGGSPVYMVQRGISASQFRSLGGAKRAVDRYYKKRGS